MAIIYDVSACFAKYRLIPVSPLDFSYFREIYNLYERENCQLKRQLGEYRELIEQSDLEREEKERYRLLFTYSELDNKSLEEQNGELRARIEELKSFKERTLEKIDSIDERLKRVEKDISDNASGINQDEFVKNEAVQRFVKHSEKFFKWLGNGEEHLRKKCVIAGMFFGFFISMLLANITVTISLGYYGTYSFVQNIWGILAICMLVYTVRARELYSFNTYSRNTIELFTLDKSFIPHKTGKKKKYVVLLALCVLSSLADIYLAISEGWSLAVIVIICELALSAFSVVYYIMALRFFDDYWAVYIIGNTVNGEALSLVLDPLTNRIVDRKLFEEKYKIN